MTIQKEESKKEEEEERRDRDVFGQSSANNSSSSRSRSEVSGGGCGGGSVLPEDTMPKTMVQENVRSPMTSTNENHMEEKGFTSISYGTVATELTSTDIDSDYCSTNAYYYDLDDGSSNNKDKREQEQERQSMTDFAFFSTDRRHTIEKRTSSSPLSSYCLPLSWMTQRSVSASSSERRRPIAIRPSVASRKRTRDVIQSLQQSQSHTSMASSSFIRTTPFSFFVSIISNSSESSDIAKSDSSVSTAATETSRLIDGYKSSKYHERDRGCACGGGDDDDCDEGPWSVEQQCGDQKIWSSILHPQSWKVTTFISTILVVLVACYWSGFRNGSAGNSHSTNHSSGSTREYYGIKSGIPGSDLLPKWEWDRNVYLPPPFPATGASQQQQQPEEEISKSGVHDSIVTNSSHNVKNHRRLALIAAITPDKSLRRLTEMSSRVNRAYARQWQMDYTEFSAGFRFHNEKSCFDKSYVLKTIIEEMATGSTTVNAHDHYASSSRLDSSSTLYDDNFEVDEEESPPRVPYDAIVLLPSDAIILDLDQNIVDTLLPPQKLAAISGWNQIGDDNKLPSNAGVVMINLRHELAKPVAELWWKFSQHRSISCGDDTGLNLLLEAVAHVFSESTDANSTAEHLDRQQQQQQHDQWTDLIADIHERSNGVLGDQSIKVIPGLVPGDRTDFLSHNMAECGEMLQQTTASVCYRFYPRCEVVP